MDPVINIQERIGKAVGRRRIPNPLRTTDTQVTEAERWRTTFGGIGVRKGLYRFKTHEEANASWMDELILSLKAATTSGDALRPRGPTLTDLVALCRELNARKSRYLVCGGFAIRATGYARSVSDVDLLIDDSPENEKRVFESLETLPDKATLGLKAGDASEYTVVRVADEITVDLMASASGIRFSDAESEIVYREIDGVRIPFASPLLLWRMKRNTHREKDQPDLYFLRRLLESQGIALPE